MSNWKSKFKNTFDNKVIVNSTIEFIGLGTLNSNGKEIELMNFKRIVNVKYKNDYLKEKDYYEYIWSFAKGQGLFKYVRIGELSLEGIIIKNELKK